MDELAPLRELARGKALWGADAGTPLEDTLNRAEFLLQRDRCQEALPLLLHIHDTITSAELDRVQFDGCTVRFWLYAGISRVCEALYYHGERSLGELGRMYAQRARALPPANARRLEGRHDPAVSNMWREGLEMYGHPEYARKLGWHEREAELYCEQLRGQKRLVRALALARRIEGLAGYMRESTSNEFAQALAVRWRHIGRYRREARENSDIGGMVAELESMKTRWENLCHTPVTNGVAQGGE